MDPNITSSLDIYRYKERSILYVQRLRGGRGYPIFFPVLRRGDTKIAPPGDIIDQPPGEMS